jgi:hypothetical protein
MQKMKGKLLYNEPDWWLTHPSRWSTERSVDAAGPKLTLFPSKGSRRGTAITMWPILKKEMKCKHLTYSMNKLKAM